LTARVVLTTGIGSLPFVRLDEARKVISLFDIPFWPQLPKKTFLENMYLQYSDGLPFSKIDYEKENIFFRLDEMDGKELETFYEHLLAEDLDYFAVKREKAAGLYSLLEDPLPSARIKGQMTGPVSFGLTVTDENKRAVFYHETFKEILVKGLTLKALWIIRELKKKYKEVYFFLDEPYLSQIGSAFVNLDPEEIKGIYSEMLAVINREAISGIHCCGNTDWNLILDLPFGIINFDAFNYSLLPFSAKLKKFLESGGKIAFGFVPAENSVRNLTEKELSARTEEEFSRLDGAGISRALIKENMLLSPSCGLATLDPALVVKELEMLQYLKRHFD